MTEKVRNLFRLNLLNINKIVQMLVKSINFDNTTFKNLTSEQIFYNAMFIIYRLSKIQDDCQAPSLIILIFIGIIGTPCTYKNPGYSTNPSVSR